MITTRTRLGTMGGIALIAIAAISVAPWTLTAQEADGEAIAKLKEENARLRQELEAMRASRQELREREAQLAQNRSRAEEQAERARAEILERRQQQAVEKVRAELDQLRTKFRDEHPEVRRVQAQLEMQQANLAALQRANFGRAGAKRADGHARRYHEQQQALLRKEIDLAERQVEYVRKALENGKELATSLLAAQRELLDLRLELAKSSGSQADERAVLLQQLDGAERLLKEQKKRIEVGTLSPGAEIPFEREVLRIKREIYGLGGPDRSE